MIIDFKDIEEQVQPNFKGGEKACRVKAHVDGQNRIMRNVLEPGASIGYHSHERNSEVIYILSGQGHILFDNDIEEDVAAGQVFYCPMGHSHNLVNDGICDLEFIAIVGEHHCP